MSLNSWFDKLSPREKKKQIGRWRYYRHYYRKKYGDRWAWKYAVFESGLI